MASPRPKQLAQLRPADTNAASLYSPPDNVTAELTRLVICNTTANTPSYRVFHDEDGTTYDQTTALFYDEPMVANTTQIIDLTGIGMRGTAGNLAVRTSAANEITFTLYGVE